MSENFHEQLSAHFDGEDSNLRLDAAFSADQQADLDTFQQIREGISAPVSVDIVAKDRQIAAALQAFADTNFADTPGVIDLNTNETKNLDAAISLPPRRNHQKWFTLAATFVLCIAGVSAFYGASSFFRNQRNVASESLTEDRTESANLEFNEKNIVTESEEEATILADDAVAEDEASIQVPKAAEEMQDFDEDTGSAANGFSLPEDNTPSQADEQLDDAMGEAAPSATTTARMQQTTMQKPLAATSSYIPKSHTGSSDLEKNTAIALSNCGVALQRQGFVLQSYAKTTIDGVEGELFFLSNKTVNNEIFVDGNCVQQ